MAAVTITFRHSCCHSQAHLSLKGEPFPASSQGQKAVALSQRLNSHCLRKSNCKASSVRSRAMKPVRAADGASTAGDVASASSSSAIEPPAEAVPRKHAIIHDFCIGITFGFLTVASSIIWFSIHRSADSLLYGILVGGSLLAASVGSLLAWKKQHSSTPYIALQAVASAVLFTRSFLSFQQAKTLVPAGISAVFSLAMVLFYIYVVAAGGNPPSKKRPKAPAA